MKKFYTLILIVLVYNFAFSQVAINTDNSAPDGSAMLDVKASDKGLLIPRVALTGTSDNTTISSPATGLLVYNTNTAGDITPGFYYYDGSAWSPLGSAAYNFENGLTENAAHTVRLGGNLTQSTTIDFGSGAFGNPLYFNLVGSGSQFVIQDNGTDNVIFNNDGSIDFKGNISSGEYYNFASIFGSTGYGFRQRSGKLEYKNNGGSWTAFPEPVDGVAYWWYRPTDSSFIQPQNNDSIRIYDGGESYGFYYNGSENQYGGFFRTTSNTFSPTAAVVGFSDVVGNRTKGYLGYNGSWTNTTGDFSLEGMAVYGEVEDRGRTSIFGRTTRDATYAAIIGYSDVWIAGYYYTLDADDGTSSHPALYGQTLVDSDKPGRQAAIEGWGEYIGGVGNRGYTVGGDFTAMGHEQDAIGVYADAHAYGSSTEATGVRVNVDSADYIYGLMITAGNLGVSATSSYGIYVVDSTSDGTGILAKGSAPANTFISSRGDGVIGVTDAGFAVFGQRDNGSGDLDIYGVLGHSDTAANKFYHYEYSSDGNGQAAVYAVRETGSSSNSGTAYTFDNTNQAIQGINYNPDSYTFAIAGHEKSSGSGRTGGVLGSDYWAWGVLGYETSTANDYGMYGNSSSTGSGKSNTASGVGVGGYGDFMGGWLRGEVYGMTVKGERYSLYVDGQTVTNDIIVNLTDVGDEQRVATYVPTAETPQIYMSGVGKLNNGKASINFDEKYRKLIDESKPVIVTVTPIGESNGLHLVSAKASGFAVAENGKGNSDVQFTWIAIAQRKTDSKPANELLRNDFDNLMEGFMFNESDTENEAQPLWWNGQLQTTKIQKPKNKNTQRHSDKVIKLTEPKKENKSIYSNGKRNVSVGD